MPNREGTTSKHGHPTLHLCSESFHDATAMATLSSIPVELFDSVLPATSDPKALCTISLVCRGWRALLRSRIYSSWSHDGHFNSIRSLWYFLRIVLGDGQIAATVRTVAFRNWTIGLVHSTKLGPLKLNDNDIEILSRAILKTGLRETAPEFVTAFRKADPRAFMALLLASLPNLTTLNAHIPEDDPFLDAVLQKAGLGSPRDGSLRTGYPLQNLSEAKLAGHWNYQPGGYPYTSRYSLHVRHVWPMFALPNLQKLSIFDPGWSESRFQPHNFHQAASLSSVTDLTLVSTMSGLDGGGPLAQVTLLLLTAPKALSKLSFSHAKNLGLRPPTSGGTLTGFKLWTALYQHKASLQHLDVYMACKDIAGRGQGNPHGAPFGSMREFKQLEHLAIQMDTLVAVSPGRGSNQITLKDTLPTGLKSLTVYRSSSVFPRKSLVEQLQDVVRSPDFALLKHIIIEDWPPNDILRDASNLRFPHDKLKQLCERAGKTYEIKKTECCNKGGGASDYYLELLENRATWEDVMYKTKLALSARLKRLRKRDGPTGRRNDDFLWLDYIDSYEMPEPEEVGEDEDCLRKEWNEFRALGFANGLGDPGSFESMRDFMGIGN
ncbi:hypothetical protein B0T14DRAFT_508758 [Immersiella caudata]|uniref:F-box domain-containing protein n=1 Tax=Immersiella caudata TaxID=314043 RepID=A0AA40C6C9_9PEZI|nr:hypothetical protein B0T14DRAFT_508758 [Immersiella caudata]